MVPATFWTLHSFQLGATFDMVAFTYVLGIVKAYTTRVGSGPFLVGFVQTNLIPAAATMVPASGAGRSGAALPQRISDEAALPLFRVPAGTEVVFEGRVIARLNQPGWARELRRYAAYSQSDVFVAVDDSVAVRGLVSVNALQPATP